MTIHQALTQTASVGLVLLRPSKRHVSIFPLLQSIARPSQMDRGLSLYIVPVATGHGDLGFAGAFRILRSVRVQKQEGKKVIPTLASGLLSEISWKENKTPSFTHSQHI